MKKLLLGVLGAGLVALGVVSLTGALSAKPQGLTDEDVGKKLANFNIIVFPGDDFGGPSNDVVCGNNGSRVFFNEDGNRHLGHLTWTLNPDNNPDFDITDCDGTVDDIASVVVNESIAFWVAIRLLGPADSHVDLLCDDIIDFIGVDDLCILDGVNVRHTKSTTFTKIIKNIVEGQLEEVMWTFSNSWNAKIIQVWIMEDLS